MEDSRIVLSYENLTSFPLDLPHTVTNVTLWGNAITNIPSEIVKFSHLRVLNIGYNKLKEISELGNVIHLEFLNLIANQLTFLPPTIGNLHYLRCFKIGHNDISMLPPEIGKLSCLRTLHLESNKLDVLPPEIGKLSRLEYLSVRDNRLTTVPPEIENLSHLTQLNLTNNQLTFIPSGIGNLSSLRYFDIGGNKLVYIPSSMKLLTNSLRSVWTYDFNDPLPEIQKKRIASLYNLCCEFINLHQLSLLQLPCDILYKLGEKGIKCDECEKIVYSEKRRTQKYWRENWFGRKVVFCSNVCLKCATTL